MLLTIAYNMALAGVRVKYITLEMDKIEVAERILSRKSDVYSTVAFRKTQSPPKYLVDKINDAKQFFRENGNLSVLSVPRISLSRLRAEIASIGYGNTADVVIVDYLQLISGRGRTESSADFYDNTAQTLAEMAKTHGYAVVTAVQLNREGAVRGGDGLLMACDCAFEIETDTYNGTDGSLEVTGSMRMVVSRYTPMMDVGAKETPAYDLIGRGQYWEERKK